MLVRTNIIVPSAGLKGNSPKLLLHRVMCTWVLGSASMTSLSKDLVDHIVCYVADMKRCMGEDISNNNST